MKRRDFIKYGMGGLTTLVVGSKMPWLMDNPAYGAVQARTLNFTITDALKDMVTHNTGVLPNGTPVGPGNPAQCYFWVYKSNIPALDADCPGPIIFASSGDPITLTVTNNLNTEHAFAIPRMRVTTGPIPPIQNAPNNVKTITFRAGPAGTYLYYDDLNAPVNRMMGLHGAFIVMPRLLPGTRAQAANRPTPYDQPTPNIQRLFNDLGHTPWWRGLAWDEGDPSTDTPPFRQYIWVLHEASSRLFAAVGSDAAISTISEDGVPINGLARDPVIFKQAFLHDKFNSIHDPANPNAQNYIPEFFTISGQSGHFSHNNPYITPYSRVGEPVLIRILNAGLWLHSTHLHANHEFVLSHNNRTDSVPGSFDNPIWIDVYSANPLDTYDKLLPYMRPPDVPNDLGIGRDDLENSLDVSNSAVAMNGFGLANPVGGPPFVPTDIPANPDAFPFYNPYPGTHLTWPAIQELNTYIPNIAQVTAQVVDPVTGAVSSADCAVLMAPHCYPMHDHSEPSQVSQGGNYNCGMIAGLLFTGDRKGARPGGAGVLTFPMKPTVADNLVAHGPDYTKGVEPPAKDFEMPTIEGNM